MKQEDWKEYIKTKLDNETGMNLISSLLFQSEAAKQLLRDKGYGWSGLSLLKTVKLVKNNRSKFKLYLKFIYYIIFNNEKVVRFYRGLNELNVGDICYDYNDGRVMIKVNNKYCIISKK